MTAIGRPALNTPGVMQATEVKITLTETLKGNTKKKASAARSPHPKKEKQEEDSAPAAAEPPTEK